MSAYDVHELLAALDIAVSAVTHAALEQDETVEDLRGQVSDLKDLLVRLMAFTAPPSIDDDARWWLWKELTAEVETEMNA